MNIECIKKHEMDAPRIAYHLHSMQLGDIIIMDGQNMSIMRVPGGWLYSLGVTGMTTTFVPFNNEFQDLFKINKR